MQKFGRKWAANWIKRILLDSQSLDFTTQHSEIPLKFQLSEAIIYHKWKALMRISHEMKWESSKRIGRIFSEKSSLPQPNAFLPESHRQVSFLQAQT